jgi:hypothetical protein
LGARLRSLILVLVQVFRFQLVMPSAGKAGKVAHSAVSTLSRPSMSNLRYAVWAAVITVSGTGALGQSVSPDTSVVRVGDYVERYYARAQSLVVDESVAIQPLALDLRAEGFPRRLTYELRVEWNPDSDDDVPAKVTRQLLTINGRPPKPDQEPECLDPRSTSPEPLAFLLADRREKFIFKAAGLGRVDGRAAMMIDYRSVKPETPKVEWRKECVSIDLPGRARGRIWADPETAEILRLDEGITGLVDIAVPAAQQRAGGSPYMTIERADSSIRYRRVAFTDPEESLLLPSSIDTTTIVRNSGSPRVRISQTFGNYRRFVTGSRLIP